jgi:hypothetical protein
MTRGFSRLTRLGWLGLTTTHSLYLHQQAPGAEVPQDQRATPAALVLIYEAEQERRSLRMTNLKTTCRRMDTKETYRRTDATV